MTQEAIEILLSIDRTLKAMLALAQQRTAATRAAQPKPVASDRDLDGKYGDPTLKFMPRDWAGASFKGRKFSECPADLLELAAETFDYFARKAEENNELTDKGKPVADYKRQDAARARGWAKRIRDGRHVQQPAATSPEFEEATGFGDDEAFA